MMLTTSLRSIPLRTRWLPAVLLMSPALSRAQESPFLTGATALQANILAWMTPVAVIDGLKDALARLRKFGGRCVLGFQSVAQVSSTYGIGDAHTIVENCANSLILRSSASEGGGTARFASSLIGDREILRTTHSRSRRPLDLVGVRTVSQQVAVEAAILPSQIEQLPDLAGYLKVASRPEWLRVRLTPVPEATTERTYKVDVGYEI